MAGHVHRPTVGRATALAAAELATYDEVKQRLLATGYFTQGLLLTAVTSFASGYVSTVASSPFDVVKSRVMGQPMNPDGTGKLYSGMVDCFVKSSQTEGVMSLYNGFWPNFGRVVSNPNLAPPPPKPPPYDTRPPTTPPSARVGVRGCTSPAAMPLQFLRLLPRLLLRLLLWRCCGYCLRCAGESPLNGATGACVGVRYRV